MYFYEHFEKVEKIIADFLEQEIDAAAKYFEEEYDGAYPTKGFGMSTLRSFHVQDGTNLPDTTVNNWRTTINSAQTWEDIINVTINRDAYIVVEGFFNRTPSPGFTDIWWKAAGKDTPAQSVEQTYVFEEPGAWMSDPFSVKGTKAFQMQAYSRVAQVELFGLRGHCLGRAQYLQDQS